MSSEANRYFASEEPWVKRKSDPARMQTILYVTAEVLRIVAIMAQPFMPASMEKLLDLLNVPASERKFANAEIARKVSCRGHLCLPRQPIFPRYIEAEDDLAKRPAVLIDSHCHLDFADFAVRARCGSRARPRRRA